MARTTSPTLDTLKQAVEIAEKIQRLESDLAAILSGGSIPEAKGKRRGRPAKVAVDSEVFAPKSTKAAKKKRVMSEEGRQRIIEAQKKRWAARKKGK